MQKKQRQAQGKICAALGAQQVREGTMDVTDMGVWGPLHRSYSRAVVIPGCSWDQLQGKAVQGFSICTGQAVFIP